MSSVRAPARKKTTVILFGLAVGLWVILGLTSLTTSTSRASHALMGKPVLENFSQTRSDAQMIRFILADDTYTLERTGTGWVMQEAGGYPIRPERLAELARGLESLTFDRKRTNDPYKLDRIGLGDPTEGGNGALVEIYGPEADLEHSLIVGRKNEVIYIREPGNTQTYRAGGTLPAFYNRRAWLDFEIITIDPSAIRSVRLTDANGRSLYLRRAPGSDNRSFRPAPPNQNDTLISRLAASSTALAITRLSALDVKPASDLISDPIGRHISETFDGLEVDLRAYRESDGLWVTLRAVEAGEGARRAEAINRKAEGWAFKITDYDFQDFTPDVLSVVER